VGQIKIKDQLSPAEAEVGAEIGNYQPICDFEVVHHLLLP